MRRIRLVLEYDGTSFYGWQYQDHRPSIAAALARAIVQITAEDASTLDIRVAGRTDRGVHALGQVATFQTAHDKEPRRFAPAINHFLPPDIRIHRADLAPSGFDPRRSASSKTYHYQIWQGLHQSPLMRHRAWHIRSPLDLEGMRKAAATLLGEHDFESFRSAHCDAPHARRLLTQLAVSKHQRSATGQLVTVSLRANAFCRHMCRIIVGTLVEIGLGDRTPESLASTLMARSRAAAGQTAPGCGLTLVAVHYPELWGLPAWGSD